MLKQAFGDEAMSGTNVLKRAEVQLKTMNVQDYLQHKKMKKTPKKFRK
jgi:hypothetical protein